MAVATKRRPARKRPTEPTPPPDFRELVREAVLKTVGRPDDLVRCEVHQLHDHRHFRVNIVRLICGRTSYKTSFYVVTTPGGDVSLSIPELKRLFFDDVLSSYL